MQYWKIVLVPICLASLTVQAADSPSFRGPRGDGQSTEQVPLRWGPQMNVKWRAALPHAGHGSPVISRGKVFVTCANAQGTQRGLYCFDRKTGKQSWSRVVAFEKVEAQDESLRRFDTRFRWPKGGGLARVGRFVLL